MAEALDAEEKRPRRPRGRALVRAGARWVTSRWLLVVVVVAGMLVAAPALVYATGGTRTAWPHLMYVPVLVAAWAFGPLGGVIAGVLAGLLVGPGMPVDVAEGTAQSTANWVYRMGFFAMIGAISGGLNQRVRQQLTRTREDQRWFEALIDHAPDVILTCDREGVVRYASPSVGAALGQPADMVAGTVLQTLVHPDDLHILHGMVDPTLPEGSITRADVRVRHVDGAWRQWECAATNLLADPAVGAVVLNARDITEPLAIKDELRHQATHDPVTGLANRTLFNQQLAKILSDPDARERTAVLLLSLDRFHTIQESLGPETGDHLVRAVAERLSARLRAGDLIARYATNEFAMLCPVTNAAEAHQIAGRLQVVADEPFLLISGEVQLSVSVGAALVRDAGGDAAQLLRDAYAALRHATMDSTTSVAVFQPDWRDQASTEMDTETALHSALQRGELELHYQPIIDLQGDRAVGAEALIRWHHPRLGMVSPVEFIPIAERTGAIIPIGRWVLQQACEQMARWRAQTGRDDLAVSVNVSVRQLDDPLFPDHVRKALAVSGLPASALTLEVTETALMGDLRRTVAALTAIKSLGVQLAVDDFGTGYSSLGYLRHLPVDVLKIDRDFVSRLGEPRDDAIVGTIIGLARILGLQTVAEGVEHREQADRLITLGCDTAQGYHFARPMIAADIAPLLDGSRLQVG